MQPEDELVQLLVDTKEWAIAPGNVDTTKLYSDWPSKEVLLSELDECLVDAQRGLADFGKLCRLYAPTAGLCEVLTSGASADAYMSLAARFDAWSATVRPASR